MRAAGVARFSWNWGLGEWNRQYETHKTDPENSRKPTIVSVKKQWSSVKHELFPWLKDSPANANLQPFTELGTAFRGFFEGKSKHPRFKKKGRCRDSFYVDNQKLRLIGKKVKLPKIGTVKMREELRFHGRILKGTVSREADRWFVSVSVEMPDGYKRERTGDGKVGVDLGILTLATLSTGEKVANPRPLKMAIARLGRAQRAHSRKKKGSANRKKSARRLAVIHQRVKNVRRDATHKLTSKLCRENQTVVIEDLYVRGMAKNRRLACSISDASFGEIRRQLEYKAPLYGSEIIVVDRFFPSSKTCSRCGHIRESIPLSQRTFTCPVCDLSMDRDLNASINLCTRGLRETHACGQDVSLDREIGQIWVKQEIGNQPVRRVRIQ